MKFKTLLHLKRGRRAADARSKVKSTRNAHGSKRSCRSGRFVSKKRRGSGCK